ncbi:hypothetical protein [Rhodococcus sp. BH5]|uniref:hypothetical protein n=1 Tax=Rhodococcus sp. BH5 TaxID=2871702 RepID=UPI0022CD3B80|nr:hypothetical protein [Rhodococcus sp. BH5]MCZ9634929.1 hypothetical protein [Rhodococcus sp. BH5]
MSVVPRKVVRKKLLHTAVLDKIEREHLDLDTDQVHHSLHRLRQHVTGASLTRCLDQWECIVRNNDIDAVREIEASDTETAREMRNLSPLSVLLSEPERLHLTNRRKPGPSGPGGGSRSELRSRPQVRIRRWDVDPAGFEFVSCPSARICS